MKILNLYAGIGGNRKLWGDSHNITAVENNEEIAGVYQDYFPKDKIVIGDAHKYLLDHYKEFDFIWSSPPCPSHSDIRRCGVHKGQYDAIYPEMSLYEEIILLQHFAKSPWCIENVRPYYTPLIPPTRTIDRHYVWSSFEIWGEFIKNNNRTHTDIHGGSVVYGYNLKEYKIKDKRKILRNLVDPEMGKFILDSIL